MYIPRYWIRQMAMTKEQKSAYGKRYYQDNKEALLERRKKHYEANKEAILEYHKKYKVDNKEAILEYKKKYYQANKGAILEEQKKYYEANKEALLEYQKKYHADNKEHIAARTKKYYQDNKAAHDRRRAERRALVANYQMTDHDKFALEEAFKLARLREEIMGGIWHVDHIVPVKHPDACGLNSAANLQVVPAVWNLSKGNRSMALWNGVSSTKASSVSS